MTFSSLFGGTAIAPAQVSYEALTLTANQALLWPTETTPGNPYVATQIDVTASSAGLQLAMPDATQGSMGQITVITNVGSNSFTLTDTNGNQIVVLSASQSWLVTLTNNSTSSGNWRALQLASTTSNAQASQLDGAGLTAVGTILDVTITTEFLSANTLITNPFLADLIVWNGASGTLQLDTIANLGAGTWWAVFKNNGTGNVTISTSASQTIDGNNTLALTPGTGALIVCASTGFNSFGAPTLPWLISQGGTGATSATNALINFGGTTIGIDIFTAPNAAAVVSLLGLNSTTLTESTVATNQTLNAGSSQTAFVCTAVLTLSLPITTSLSKSYIFAAYAQGGTVTITPNAADKINNGSAGASYSLTSGASVLFTTDANGNWWPFYAAAGGTVTSVALSDGSTTPIYTVSGSPVTSSGTLTFTLSTQSANKVFAGPTTGSAAQPTFRSLVTADMPALSAYIDTLGSPAQGDILYRNATTWVYLAPGTNGQFLQTQGAAANPQWASPSGSGTVNAGTAEQLAYYGSSGTAVSGNADATISAGVLTLGIASSVIGKLVLAGNSSGAITIAPQAAAGTYNFNLPTSAGSSGLPLLSGGGGSSPMTWGSVGVAAGGTGQTSLTQYNVLLGNGTSAVAFAAPGTAGNVLTSNGPSADPSFQAPGGTFTAGTAAVMSPWTASSQVSQAHGLGAQPSMLVAYYTCLTASGGYNVGDRVYAATIFATGQGASATSASADTTNVYISAASVPPTWAYKNGATGFYNVVAADWSLTVVPYLFA